MIYSFAYLTYEDWYAEVSQQPKSNPSPPPPPPPPPPFEVKCKSWRGFCTSEVTFKIDKPAA